MAFLQFDEASGRYRIRFYYGGQEFKRSIKTKIQKVALGIQARVEETVRLLEQGRLEIPAGADPAAFILSDGKLTHKPVAQRVLTLADLFGEYEAKFPAGCKEASTASTERIHRNHLLRLVGGKTAVQNMTTATIQDYIEQRSQEAWRGKSIKPQTVKKEVETLRAVWNWAVEMGLLTGQPPVKGARHGKSKERPPFQTWEEIDRTIARAGTDEGGTGRVVGVPVSDAVPGRRGSGLHQGTADATLRLPDVRLHRPHRGTTKRNAPLTDRGFQHPGPHGLDPREEAGPLESRHVSPR